MDQLLSKKTGPVILFVLFLLMACKGETGEQAVIATGERVAPVKELSKNAVPGITGDTPQITADKSYPTCEALIADLVKSSNAPALKNFKAVQSRTLDINAAKISVELYVINNVSEDPEGKPVEHTVGWLEFFPATGILQDITNDPERPETLQYNTAILQTADWDKLCPIPLKKTERQ